MGNEVSSTAAHKGSNHKNNKGSGEASAETSAGARGGPGQKQKGEEDDQRLDTVPLEKEDTTAADNRGRRGGGGGGAATAVEAEGEENKPLPPAMEASAVSLGPAKPEKRAARVTNPDQVMITDALTDVRMKYHINPREIGHGHYGVVRKCMDRQTREWYAIKSIRKSKVGKIEVLKREINILKEVHHPNIIRLIEVHEDVKYLHLVTELCTGGELFDRIIAKTQSEEGHFSEKDAAHIVRCILDAIAYCHDVKQIVHRDLKPENFLFKTEAEDAEIKIIDFGLSRHDTQNFGVMKTKVGTPYYVAPEVLNREYTKSCDIWSIGVITYILLCGYPPFYGDSDNQIFDSVRTGRFDFPSPDWDCISDAAKDFICCLLRKDPSKRLTASQAMKHRWIKEQTEQTQSARNKVSHSSRKSVTFKKFLGMQKLKKAALAHIATNLTQAELGEMGEIFRKVDVGGKGVLTLQELDDALAHGGLNADVQADLKKLREDLSLSGEDKLNWRDFLAAMMDRSVVMQEDKLRMAFDHFHKSDGDYLLLSDLVDYFGGEAQAKEIMGSVDTDGDGRISYEDFRQMMEGSFSED